MRDFAEKSWPLQRGFTLIELLIVVAIIAVLALIAVPNFLAAQTRAKVSKAKSDFRTLKVALEAYRVDYHDYVYDFDCFGGAPNDWTTWCALTTPVSYLTSVLANPFRDTGEPKNPFSDIEVYEYWGDWEDRRHFNRYGLAYLITSVGPDLHRDSAPGNRQNVAELNADFVNRLYDPTNGAVSRGDLVASNQQIY